MPKLDVDALSENTRLKAHATLTRNLSERYGESSSSNGRAGSDAGDEATMRELQDFDALVNQVLEQCVDDTRFADPALCRNFVEQRLRLELLELQDKHEEEAESHIAPYDEQEERRKQYCLAEERRKDAAWGAARRTRACKPGRSPPSRRQPRSPSGAEECPPGARRGQPPG